jgi:diguanylate cyclase (GGDEF)-like protein
VRSLQQLIQVRSKSEARRVTVMFALVSAVLAGLAGALLWSVPTSMWNTMALSAAVGGVIAGVMTVPMAQASLALHQREQALAAEARTDAMTGVLNRRGFFELTEAGFARPDASLTAILVDLDGFKLINDTFGHAGGDRAIKAVATLIRGVVEPEGARVGRLGGDEFCVVAFDLSDARALALAETVRAQIEQTLIEFEGKVMRPTVSMGYAVRVAADEHVDMLLARADAALYAAKANGRNKVCASPRAAA